MCVVWQIVITFPLWGLNQFPSLDELQTLMNVLHVQHKTRHGDQLYTLTPKSLRHLQWRFHVLQATDIFSHKHIGSKSGVNFENSACNSFTHFNSTLNLCRSQILISETPTLHADLHYSRLQQDNKMQSFNKSSIWASNLDCLSTFFPCFLPNLLQTPLVMGVVCPGQILCQKKNLIQTIFCWNWEVRVLSPQSTSSRCRYALLTSSLAAKICNGDLRESIMCAHRSLTAQLQWGWSDQGINLSTI